MRHWDKIRLRFRSVFRRDSVERELDTELRFHLEAQIDENRAAGMSDDEARYAAVRTVGSITQLKEEVREMWGGILIQRFGQELRYAVRTLLKSPGFAVLSILTLSLGIGVTTTMFSVLNGVLLRPLAYRNPGRLVTMYSEVPRISRAYPELPVSAYYVAEWRKQAHTLEGVAALSSTSLNLGGSGDPERLTCARVSADLFELLGVQTQLGRTFLPGEDEQGKSRVAILSDGLWRRRFGGDPNILNSTIQLNGEPYSVAGVMAPDFRFPKNDEIHRLIKMPAQTDIWIPLVFTTAEMQVMQNQNYAAIARLKPGVSIQAANGELNGILKRLPNIPKEMDVRVHLNPLQTDMVSRVRQGLIVLMAAVAAVLLLSCINIANLLLTRATNRRREISVRAALGASRIQLFLTPAAESLAVALFGAAGGILVANALLDLVLLKLPINLPRMDEVSLDGRTLAFAMLTTLISAVGFGLIPALRYSAGDLARGLRDSGRGSTGGVAAGRLRSALISVESGMTAALLVIAGLLIHSFVKVTGIDQGFRTSNVIAADVALSGPGYLDPQKRIAFYRDVVAKLSSLPRTEALGAVSALPLTGETTILAILPEGDATPMGQAPQTEYRSATRGYFAAANIPLLRGRLFEDRADGPKVAVISVRTAERIWPGRDPIGRRFNSPGPQGAGITVVGVVGDVRSAGLDKEPPLMVYLPIMQRPSFGASFVIRTPDQNPGTGIRQSVAAVDPMIPVAKIRPLAEVISGAAAVRRFQMILLGCFALMALALSAIGMYGVVSYSVAQRRSELGVRIALGAGTRAIRHLVLWDGLKPVLSGMTAGLVAAYSVGRVIASLLYSVPPLDLTVYGLTVALLITVSLAACWLPARAATRTDPMLSIRSE
jgi:putative ABC transport system permease protein